MTLMPAGALAMVGFVLALLLSTIPPLWGLLRLLSCIW